MRSDMKTYAPMEARIASVRQETGTIRTFRLRFRKAADRKRFSFMPGQFGLFSVMGVGEATFSMCSPPSGDAIEISVRNVGNTTNAMFSMRKGDTIGVRGPYGHGYPMDGLAGKDLILVAGGIGFPPLASVMEYAIKRRKSFGDITLIYGVKDMGDIIYRDRAERWGRSPGVTVITTVEEKCREWHGCTGLVTKALEKLRIDAGRTAGLSCGPPVMLRFVSADFTGLGIPADRIYLSLERLMQCGIGKCGHCNIGDKYVCRDGPVFQLSELRRMKEDAW